MNFFTQVDNILLEDVNPSKGSQPVTVMAGRYQPFTKGHLKVITEASNPVVIFVVKGAKTSLDKERNPLDFDIQKLLIELGTSGEHVVDIIEVQRPDFGIITDILRDKDMEMVEFMCGADREKSYNSMLDRYKDKLQLDMKVVTVDRDDDDVSASDIRDAIRKKDYNTVVDLMVNVDEELVEELASKF